METITINNITLKIGDKVNIKNDPSEYGFITKFKLSGYSEEYRKYDMFIEYYDGQVVRTPFMYFVEEFELSK